MNKISTEISLKNSDLFVLFYSMCPIYAGRSNAQLNWIFQNNGKKVSLVVSTSRQIEIEIENVLSVETNF